MHDQEPGRMNHRRLAALLLCAGLLLCMAGSALAQEPAAAVREAMAAYEDVLLGRRTYVQSGADGAAETLFSAKPGAWYGFTLDGRCTVARFCLTDLDADGLPEIILDVADAEGYTFGYELLRYEAGTVYGFGFGIRAMQNVTLEGDVATSSGAGDNGWYTLKFSADQVEYVETCRMQSTNEYEQYFIGKTEVKREDYLAFTDALLAKPQPVWLSFTSEALGYVMAQFQ